MPKTTVLFLMKNILVTGCASGIGHHIALSLIKQGHNVIGLDINEIEIPNLSSFYKTDCSQEREVQAVFANFGRLDVAINCAGISGIRKEVIDLHPKEILNAFDTNFLGTFFCMQQELVMMRKVKQGKIINIASILGHIGVQKALSYAASKAAIIALTKTAAAENADYNIQINSISPATINTPLVRKLNQENPKNYAQIYPIGHCGNVSDVQGIVNMLIHNNFMTGSDIKLDGGLTDTFSI